jgi:hypothetical protein
MKVQVIRKSARARDFQRQRLYDWENARFAAIIDSRAPKLDMGECAALVRIACRAFKLHALPQVTDGRGARRASGSPRRVKLPKWARSPHVVLHETAHAITRYHLPRSSAHGAEFCGMYAELLARFCGYQRAALIRDMRAGGLRVTEPERWLE